MLDIGTTTTRIEPTKLPHRLTKGLDVNRTVMKVYNGKSTINVPRFSLIMAQPNSFAGGHVL